VQERRAENEQEALVFKQKLASGDAEAMFQMGMQNWGRPGYGYYPDGSLVPDEDSAYRGAAKWFRRAAERGHTGAMIQLAHLYNSGQGVPRDMRLSRDWFQRAFNAGERDHSPYWLGDDYLRGEGGVQQDYTQALHYLILATGPYPFEKLLARQPHDREPLPVGTSGAVFGDNAMRKISLIYRCGWGVPVDLEKANIILRQCVSLYKSRWCEKDLNRQVPCEIPAKGERLDD